MIQKIAIIWFRQDLRLHDNIAFNHAIEKGYDILPIFILDDENAGEWKRGSASRWWLNQSLKSLNQSLDGNLVFRIGKADEILPALAHEIKAKAVFWNRCYEPWRIERDTHIKQDVFKDLDIDIHTFKDSLLWEPWEVLKNDDTPYKVFTPFYRKGCLSKPPPNSPLDKPDHISYASYDQKGKIENLNLMPTVPWYKSFESVWTPGEGGARAQLTSFLSYGIEGYKEDRNRPDLENVSRLSPYLHFGEISPRVVWHEAQSATAPEKDIDHFCSELGWREFSYYLLYHFPHITRAPLQEKFKAFPWAKNPAYLEKWQKGQTGIPIVDAGMRQLWQTGWMHNRVRMIVASVLVKNMMIHWHEGENWFWDTLVDADLANNSASWQWVAGSGADAAPYFRIFNAITQGEKFDPHGTYIREYVPELRDVPDKHIHKPWEIDGHEYPAPLIDLKKTRVKALEAFRSLE